MSDTRLDLSALREAVSALEDGLEVVSDTEWINAQSSKVRNTLISGVIQGFEFVYEISVKMIKRQIEAQSASPDEVDKSDFRELLRAAAEKGLISNVEAWFGYRKMRNITAHTYDREKAQQVYHNTLTFINDARALLHTLEERNA